MKYQQNEHSTLISTHWTHKRPRHIALDIQAPAWDRHKLVTGINRVNGIPTPPFLITVCIIVSN